MVTRFLRHNNIKGHPEAWSDLKPLKKCLSRDQDGKIHQPQTLGLFFFSFTFFSREQGGRKFVALSESPKNCKCRDSWWSFPILARTHRHDWIRARSTQQSHTHTLHKHTQENFTSFLHYHLTVLQTTTLHRYIQKLTNPTRVQPTKHFTTCPSMTCRQPPTSQRTPVSRALRPDNKYTDNKLDYGDILCLVLYFNLLQFQQYSFLISL